VAVAWFGPAFAPELAPAPPSHRALVGRIVHPAPTPIAWRTDWTLPLSQPPLLRWHDAAAPAGTRYTLYAFDVSGRIWLATHEWSKGGVVLEGDEAPMLAGIYALLPRGVDLTLVLRRVPATPDERPEDLPASAPLPFRRE
jgi:hypothetical protein